MRVDYFSSIKIQTMNSFQFRTGNFFLSTSVQQIDHSHLALLHKSNGDAIDEIKPVPITEDWLITFGFTKVKSSWRSPNPSFSLEIFGRGKLFLYTQANTTEVFWVHQLQNHYFQICGEELTVKHQPW